MLRPYYTEEQRKEIEAAYLAAYPWSVLFEIVGRLSAALLVLTIPALIVAQVGLYLGWFKPNWWMK